jgi:hypothetical protein
VLIDGRTIADLAWLPIGDSFQAVRRLALNERTAESMMGASFRCRR